MPSGCRWTLVDHCSACFYQTSWRWTQASSLIGGRAPPLPFRAIEAALCGILLCFGCYYAHYILFCGITSASLLDWEELGTCSPCSCRRGPCWISFLLDFQFLSFHKRLHLDSIPASLRQKAKLVTLRVLLLRRVEMSFSSFSKAQFLILCAAYLITILLHSACSCSWSYSYCHMLPLSQNWKTY